MGRILPCFRAVCLALLLCAGVCPAQESNAPPQQPSTPAPVSTPPGDSTLSAGLNSLQGLKVALIQINSPGIDNPEHLLPLLPQKVNEPLDKYKVRQSVQDRKSTRLNSSH